MEINNASMLARMKIDSFKAAGLENNNQTNPDVKGFQDALKSAINNVVEAQESSKVMSEGFARGDLGVSLIDAKIASEVAEVKTQILIASTQKVLKAYRDISTMSI